MTEIALDIDRLKEIEENCISCISSFYNRNRSTIFLSLIIIVVASVFLTIVITNKSSPSSPCLSYSSQTLANQISIACLQYTWNLSCPSKRYLFSANYQGYWNSSPQGTSIVSCTGSSIVCGIGSYGNLLTYMQYCNNV